MSNYIDGEALIMSIHKDVCYDLKCKECSMCTENGGCRIEEWIDKFPAVKETK